LLAIFLLLLGSAQFHPLVYSIETGVTLSTEKSVQNECTEQSTISERKSLFSEFALLELLNSDETSSFFRARANYSKSGLSVKELQLICISDNKSKKSLNSCYSNRIFPLLV
jgi:hypothetical protein